MIIGMGLWDLLPGGRLHLVSGLGADTQARPHAGRFIERLDHPRAGESDLSEVPGIPKTEFNLSRALQAEGLF